MSVNETAMALMEAMEKKAGTQAYDTQATVIRVDGDTLYVHIPGGVEETPVRRTINANEGDTVQIRVGGGSAWVVGNATAPPTDDKTANNAMSTAVMAVDVSESARAAALTAEESAELAKASAETAQESAEIATNSAQTALTQLSVVEDVVGTLNWISEHGEYQLSTDTEVVPGKLYFTKSGDVYTPVSNPTGNPSAQGYYELSSVDEAVSNYVASHLALTSAGLYVISDSNSWRVLIKNDRIQIIDSSGNVVAEYGTTVQIGKTGQSNIKIDSRTFKLVDKDGHTFLEARDLRDASGIAEVVDYFVGDGNNTIFYLSDTPIGSVSVTIDNVATSAYTITDDTVLIFNQAPRTGAEIRVAYNGDSMSLVEMTLGGRNSSYPVGATSFTVGSGNAATGPYTRAFGFDTKAHGYYSGAEGSNTVALGYASHAEGTLTSASGESSHAEGRESDASGVYSHAQNYGTDASGLAQTALGMYNVSDPSGNYAVIIGNGSDDSSRSNALTIDWSGNVNTAGNVTANGVSVSELNKKALGIRGQIGALSSWNIDDMAPNETYGTWWLNIGDADITGTKPTSSGSGLLFCTRQSSGITRQYYRGVTVRGDYYRYYTHSTGVWTAWEPVPGIPLIDSFTGTTSANGNFSHAFSKNVVVFSAWANTSDKIVSAYPSGGTTTGGATTWWFHVRNANANGTVVASTSTTVTVSYMYI